MLENYPDMLNVQQASSALNMTEHGLRLMCRQGRLPSVKIGRRVLIPKALLVEYIEKNLTGVE